MQSTTWEGSSLHFMVGTDGSGGAHMAFQAVMDSLMHHSDRITVSHIYNTGKTYLPYDMQPDALKQKYESLTIGLGSRVRLFWEESDPKTTTKEHMIQIAKNESVSIIVVGMNGRKGPKE